MRFSSRYNDARGVFHPLTTTRHITPFPPPPPPPPTLSCPGRREQLECHTAASERAHLCLLCAVVCAQRIQLRYIVPVTLTQVRDGIHTFLAQSILEKWQQASAQYPEIRQQSQPNPLPCFHTNTDSSYPFHTLQPSSHTRAAQQQRPRQQRAASAAASVCHGRQGVPTLPPYLPQYFVFYLILTRGCSAGGSTLLTPPRPPPPLYPCASTGSLVRSDPPLRTRAILPGFPPKTGFQLSTIAVNLLSGQIISLVGAPPTRIQGLYFMQAVLDEFGSSRRRSSSLPTEAHTRCESSFDRHWPPMFWCCLMSPHARHAAAGVCLSSGTRACN
jgi:hypothetical protein